MKIDVITHLTIAFSRLWRHWTDEPIQLIDREDDSGREPSARDYELYYWCSTPAAWY
ncbi:hypothetical protein [Rhizobium sp. BK602]|uniref:hypothetical protein n=1 Tax=Rhizobium sp. BK602 TaxID=2586986 RepID=UPI00180A71C5|nr:hypothetical protein [Rhizobium sp. BK602]MBB3609479.1 hypothetical protein [Rhizobium sp. BK602]